MNGSDFERLDAIFQQAIDVPAAERAAFLDQACANDAALRQKVESLLASDGQTLGFLESAIASSAQSVLLGSGETQFGDWQVLERIGQGGMGSVWLAERSGQGFTQRAAIKLIRGGMNTPEVMRRFLAERRILARLDHPSIARLLDGGATPGGLPWLAMEYVEGQAVDAYCQRMGYNIVERLKLFRVICGAVAHAHQHLIVHRDLKPSNILVTQEGVPKLLDFGVAKILAPVEGEEEPGQTRTRLLPMTPEYASPEQVRGTASTTATDVYSLGVILYELLTGQRPCRIKGRTPAEIEEAVCVRMPERPSRVAGERAARALAGDLDTIVLTALQKEPGRRYGSVQALSDDIGRHLDGYPVEARRDTFAYRASKYLRRNRLAVTAAGVVMVSLAGLAVTTAMLFTRVNGERDIARRFTAELAGKLDRELSGQPEARLRSRLVVAEAYRALGMPEKAEQELEAAVTLGRRMVDLRRLQQGPDDVGVAREESLLAACLTSMGQPEEAGRLLQHAVAVLRRKLGPAHAETREAEGRLAAIEGR